jgi:hypothetical protein
LKNRVCSGGTIKAAQKVLTANLIVPTHKEKQPMSKKRAVLDGTSGASDKSSISRTAGPSGAREVPKKIAAKAAANGRKKK